ARGYSAGGRRGRELAPRIDGDDGGTADCRVDENRWRAADHVAADHSTSCRAAACPLARANGTGSQHHRLPVGVQRTAALLYAGHACRTIHRRVRLCVLSADLPGTFLLCPPAAASIG